MTKNSELQALWSEFDARDSKIRNLEQNDQDQEQPYFNDNTYDDTQQKVQTLEEKLRQDQSVLAEILKQSKVQKPGEEPNKDTQSLQTQNTVVHESNSNMASGNNKVIVSEESQRDKRIKELIVYTNHYIETAAAVKAAIAADNSSLFEVNLELIKQAWNEFQNFLNIRINAINPNEYQFINFTGMQVWSLDDMRIASKQNKATTAAKHGQ